MTYVTIDRFEGTQAVLEDDEERTFAVPRERLPAGAKPGDVLESEGGAYIPAPEETEKRRAEAPPQEGVLRQTPPREKGRG